MVKLFIISILFMIFSCGDDSSEESCSSGTYDCEGICDGNAVEDCNGECGGSAIEDCSGACNGDFGVLPNGEILSPGQLFINQLDNQELEIWYNTEAPIFGFQFDIYGITINQNSVTSDVIESSGLDIVFNNFNDQGFVRILGYRSNLEDSDPYLVIPIGCGTLLGFSYIGEVLNINNIVFGGINGNPISMIEQLNTR